MVGGGGKARITVKKRRRSARLKATGGGKAPGAGEQDGRRAAGLGG